MKPNNIAAMEPSTTDQDLLAGVPREKVQALIRRTVGCTDLAGPAKIFAEYDDGPDKRCTALFHIQSSDFPKVVVKINGFPFLKGSVVAHQLVSDAAPENAPILLGWEAAESGSVLVFSYFEGVPLSETMSASTLEDAALTLARIQQKVAPKLKPVSGLDIVSLSDFPKMFDDCLNVIQANIHEAWERDGDGKIEKAMGFQGSDVLTVLEPLRTDVQEWCRSLSELGIEPSLDHGDCHAGNIAILPGGRSLIFDWENTCVSHPFFSAEKLLTSAWAFDAKVEGGPWGYVRNTPTQDAVRTAYLSCFNQQQLVQGFNAAMCLAVIKEMWHEMEWARLCDWPNQNPEWTAQLINRLLQHRSYLL